MRRTIRIFATTNRYTDGSGRKLDALELPTDLYLEPLNDPKKFNAYPAKVGHWQPVIRGEPSPFKGNIMVVGAGIVGSLAASMFALRGFHITVVDKCPEEQPPLFGIESALVTKRGLDCLEAAGVRKSVLKTMGTRVTGVLDHPTNVNVWFTRGLSELHPFAVNMLSVDMKSLRGYVNNHLQNNIPWRNAKIFNDHKCVAVLPDVRKCVVLPLRDQKSKIGKRGKKKSPTDSSTEETTTEEESEFAKTKEVVIGGKRFFEDVEGVDFDLLIAADGVNSSVRSMIMPTDGPESTIYSFKSFGTKWFAVEGAGDMDYSVVHRWVHTFGNEYSSKEEGEGKRTKNHGVIFAFPRGANTGCFSVMAYMPMEILQRYSVTELMKEFCGDYLKGTYMHGTETQPEMAPTVFNYELYNKNDMFPNVLLLGDAAHHRNPYMLQNLAMSLEDVAYCVNTIDQRNVTMPDCIRQFSRERGVAGDRLRIISERGLYYAQAKHYNPIQRFRNFYAHTMHYAVPRSWNEIMQSQHNYMYPRSVESMLNGRGYTSYEHCEAAQTRGNKWWHFMRIYT